MNPYALAGGFFLGGAAASLALARRPVAARFASCAAAVLGSAAILAEAASCLAWGTSSALSIPGPFGAWGFAFRMTPLSALFAALVAAVSILASVYAMGYARDYDRRAGALGFFYDIFLLAMSLVPAADNAFSFLFVWEGMTLASFFLVLLDHEEPRHRQAGYLYFTMSQAGTAFIFAAFLLLWRAAGSMEFSAFAAAGPGLGPGLKDAVFILALIGFGLKAGVVPLHLWLPYAHPAAPSHVSCLMSGVMIKTGVYGLLLVALRFLGGGPWWWGAVILCLAAASSLLGVLYALVEHDLKRLLAYHSVENIGIILMGIGAGMTFASLGRPEPALLAFCAGLYHTVNHAVFKCLLFQGAGSVLKAAGTRDLERMGGLVKTMPVTAACFLTGCMAISALPPLNGFISEWLTFQALLSGFGLPSAPCRLIMLTVAASLALTGGLAAACFVKAFGVGFLAAPRGEGAASAKEASLFELASMLVLSALCLALGLFPGRVMGTLRACLAGPLAAAAPYQAATLASGPLGAADPAALLALLILAGAGAWLAARVLGGPAAVRKAPTWGCGLPELTPRMEYTATAFSKPFRLMFAFLFRPTREARRGAEDHPYFPRTIRYSTEISHVILEKLYHPPVRTLLRASHAIRRIQAGSINIYLGYLSATVTALLLMMIWRSHR